MNESFLGVNDTFDFGNNDNNDSIMMMMNDTSSLDISDNIIDNIIDNNNNMTELMKEAELVEEEHEFDAISALALNITIIGCLLLAYYVKQQRMYYLPESAGAILVGIIIGGIVRLTTENLTLFEFSPEIFFFVLLPPIIFEAGYSLDRKGFFENIGAITLYAMFGTMISTFIVGGLCFYAAKAGIIHGIDIHNPMESLMFGSLISAVDPVATLSIMGNAELNVDPLLYSLVFGESVLNDAIAISLFKTFFKYYNPDGPDWNDSEIPTALFSFVTVSMASIGVGVGLGLFPSWLYKHLQLQNYPSLETSLLFCFCYLCYATAEAIGLSGIMALFFQGVVLSHYNSYNLSSTAHVASEQIFSTLSTLTETVVFIYMGMGVFTGRFQNWNIGFTIWALLMCLIGRFLNIIPLSCLANACRKGRQRITLKMQVVLWFAGLRGAIAFALSENMPGPYKENYATATLSICIFTTVVCGGFTERMLTVFEMKEDPTPDITIMGSGNNGNGDSWNLNRLTYTPPPPPPSRRNSRLDHHRRQLRDGIKGVWDRFDDQVLKPHFGGEGETHHNSDHNKNNRNGNGSVGVPSPSRSTTSSTAARGRKTPSSNQSKNSRQSQRHYFNEEDDDDDDNDNNNGDDDDDMGNYEMSSMLDNDDMLNRSMEQYDDEDNNGEDGNDNNNRTSFIGA